MLRPAVNQIITKNETCYSREITQELYDNDMTIEEKPVKTAVEELASGKYKIVSTQKNTAE